ncbi:MAG TPA: quinone-dependent dihydroorotate dehydrogenase [Nocardioides sp.]|nr:quinone-dependent dihydroorotate dehydrogenase [Nocardioides sp.]
MRLYDAAFKHGFARVEPEKAHHLAFGAIRAAGPVLARAPFPGKPVHALGLRFPNVLGLAAGFDKLGVGYDALAGLGFGHVEVGTVTALAQPGNPQPRLFRLVEDRAVINRMGFNNDGAAAVAQRLAAHRRTCGLDRLSHRKHVVLGINIGKSKVVPDEDQAAVEADYATSTRLLTPHADYLVVNVSSPNTPGLRNLQAVEKLAPLLTHVRRVADETRPDHHVPLLVKIAPDLADEDVTAVAEMALSLGLDGIIATNTTISREGLRASPEKVAACGAGGLSGAPLKARSTEVVRRLRARVGHDLTLIGVGGISDAADARERLDAGADLIQGYTAFIYGGPTWPREILKGLNK